MAGDHHKHFQEINIATQIVAVADVFDALTAPRCYSREFNGIIQGYTKNGLSSADAIDVMLSDPRQGSLNKQLVILFSEGFIKELEKKYYLKSKEAPFMEPLLLCRNIYL